MSLSITEIREEEKKAWDRFAATSSDGGLLQSWQWGDVIRAEGHHAWRLMVQTQDGDTVGICDLAEYPLPGGLTYLISSRGPIIADSREDVFFMIMDKVREIGRSIRAVHWKMEPVGLTGVPIRPDIMKVANRSPEESLILDLTRDEKDLLGAMHSKTRYNIRLAEKKPISIRTGTFQDIGPFYKILEQTATRDGIGIFPQVHYENIFTQLQKNSHVQLYLAEVVESDGKKVPIAGIIVAYFGRFAVYLHGASSNSHRNMMAPYLLQWTAIKEAKQSGFQNYDFYGVSSTRPQWAGITRFKAGFAPVSPFVVFNGTYDVIFNLPLYTLMHSAKAIRGLLKSFSDVRRKRVSYPNHTGL